MNKIHQLPDHLIAKIAAGEVIERPVYAIKELVENSLDAGADSITIELEDAGLKRITVIDNGEGMSKEDLLESFKPHTTSKVGDVDQIAGIKTLGFRGEALSSIASVSNMIIQSKEEKEVAGNQVNLLIGLIQKIQPAGMPKGTSITVNNLFYSTPARKKFLKSNQTELRLSTELITQYCAAYPNTRFTFSHNGRTILDLPKNNNLLDRIKLLLGKDIFEYLLPVNYQNPHISISGFISHPQRSSTTNQKQYLYINSRNVSDRSISNAVRSSYGNMLDSNQYPIFVLFINLPHDLVDVNVHPRKEQVSFVNPELIYEAVISAITQTLQENNLNFKFNSKNLSITKSYAGELLKEMVSTKIIDLDSVIQIHNLYLIVSTNNGIMLIDQHASHERILYEEFLSKFKQQKNKGKSFQLKRSVTLDLSITDTQKIMEFKSSLEELGFRFEEFGNNSFKVTAVPEIFQDRDITTLINELLDNTETYSHSLDNLSEQLIKYLACRSAVKAGDKLTTKEAEALIKKLEKTKNNTTCPHGRPTKIEIELTDINRSFKR